MLIDDQLMRDFLRKKGPTVGLEEVNKQVAELTESLKKEKKTLADYLKEQNQTEAQLRTDITGWLQWNAFVKQQVTEADLKRYYDESKDFFDRVVVRASHIVLRHFVRCARSRARGSKGQAPGVAQGHRGR